MVSFRITPRAYILPFILLLLCHHLPLWLFWIHLNPSDAADDSCDYTFSRWIAQTFVLHAAIPSACALSIVITFLSPIHRSMSKRSSCLSETPVIALVFVLYIALVLRHAYGIYESHACFPVSMHPRGGIFAFDFTMSILVVFTWIASTCSRKPLSEADFRDQCTSRLRCLTYAFVCRRYDEEEVDMYSFLAESMAQFFYVRRRDFENVLPLPDVLFALHLVAKRQASERKLVPPPSPSIVMTDPSILDDAIRYGKLAGGIYGWRVFLYYNPFSCHKVLACCHSSDVRRHLDAVREHSTGRHGPRDDLSFVSYTGLVHTSVQYISGANELFKVPFSVCRDDAKKEIVVAIRGSLSWHDVLTDVLGQTIPMTDGEAMRSPDGASRPIHTHEGALRSARHLLHELQSGTLRELFWDFAQANCRLDDPAASWRVVLTGHSLGGGIAALLTIMLRKELNVHSFLFAPMAVLDGVTADWSAPYMTTFIYGDDWIPRLSTPNIMRLRNEIMREYQLVSNATLLSVYLAWFDPTRMEPQIHSEWADLELLQPDAGAALVIPGTIFQIAPKTRARLCTCEKLLGRQELECVRRPRHDFDRIWVNYRAVVDHFPHHYDHTLVRMQESMRDVHIHDVL